MKYLVVSDIHGSIDSAEILIEKFLANKCDKILLLGDILYHGPRNALSPTYNPMRVAELLNEMKDKIIAIHGNCDSEVDEMVLKFPLVNSMFIGVGNRRAFLTHGHIYNEAFHPNLSKGDILIHGHFHIPWLFDLEDGVTIASPGSISIPKNGSSNSYMIIDNDKIVELLERDDIRRNKYLKRFLPLLLKQPIPQ